MKRYSIFPDRLSLLLLLGCGLLLSSCASWQKDADTMIAYAQKAGVEFRMLSAPLINAKCKTAQEQCVARGITSGNQCPDWMTCDAFRANVSSDEVMVQQICLDAKAALALADQTTTQKKIDEAINLIGTVRTQLKAWKVLP